MLTKPQGPLPTVFDIMNRISYRLLLELQNSYSYADNLRDELAKEVENGRLFRLVVKLGFINERPEYKNNPSWSETENRYLLKLFRDYVFHQNSDDGTPIVDFGHVVDSLNKLDAGTQEKILLMSRDQSNMLIANFGDLKKSVKDAFFDLEGPSSNAQIKTQRRH